jgi:2-oxoglutarate ferredoxin oxidoreductase subunit gamma
MTYNFDPERWYANERAALEADRRTHHWSDERYEAAVDDLDRRHEEMLQRLDGTYQIPVQAGSGPSRGRADAKRPRRFEIRIAGFGGQGVVTIGKILGTAFTVHGGRNSVNTQSYGPESRGGACRSEVVVAEGEINYPYVRRADVLVALSQVALDTYVEDLKEGGILVIDPQAVKSVPRPERFRVVPVPTLAIAHETGDVKFQNMAALGALYALIADLIREPDLLSALREGVPPATVDRNTAAFEKGKHYVRSHFTPEP